MVGYDYEAHPPQSPDTVCRPPVGDSVLHLSRLSRAPPTFAGVTPGFIPGAHRPTNSRAGVGGEMDRGNPPEQVRGQANPAMTFEVLERRICLDRQGHRR